MSGDTTQPIEFSFEISLDDVGGKGRTYRLTVDEAARARIAERFAIPAVHKLEGELSVSANRTSIRVEGSLEADLTRICVASLEEMEEAVRDEFEVDFLRSVPEYEDEDEEIDLQEVHEGDVFDLGEFLVQQLSLAMDPFPRKEGAVSLAEGYAPKENDSPFAALQGLVGKEDENQ